MASTRFGIVTKLKWFEHKFINTSQNIFGAKSCEKLPIMMRVSRSLKGGKSKRQNHLTFKSILFMQSMFAR